MSPSLSLRLAIILVLLIPSTSFGLTKSNEAIQKTIEWNQANNQQDISKLLKLYGDTLIGYGQRISKHSFLVAKKKFFKENSGFAQVIVSDLTIKKLEDGTVLLEFLKKVSAKGTSKDYPAYLLFKKVDRTLKIIEEGDKITDKNMGYSPILANTKSTEKIALSSLKGRSYLWLYILVILAIISGGGVFAFRWKKFHTTNRDVNQPEQKEQMSNYEKGYAFEKFVVESFDKGFFSIVRWQGDKGINGRYAEENHDPDVVFRLETNTKGWEEIAVECKYRSNSNWEDEFSLCSDKQLKHYQKFERVNKMKTFIVVGVGGKPNAPEDLYVLEVRKMRDGILHESQMGKYKKDGASFFYDMYKKELR